MKVAQSVAFKIYKVVPTGTTMFSAQKHSVLHNRVAAMTVINAYKYAGIECKLYGSDSLNLEVATVWHECDF